MWKEILEFKNVNIGPEFKNVGKYWLDNKKGCAVIFLARYSSGASALDDRRRGFLPAQSAAPMKNLLQ